MNRGASHFLRAVVVLIGLGALAFLVWEPRVEGRNVGASNFQIYFQDPFLAFAYVGSIPFFVGLWHAFKVLGYGGSQGELTASAVRSVRIIKFCAIALVGFVLVGEVFIFLAPDDDKAGGVMMGVAIAFLAIVVAAGTAMLERTLQRAVDLKAEHDLTV